MKNKKILYDFSPHVRESLVRKIMCMCDDTGLTDDTIYKMAIIHGIQSVSSGYIPTNRIKNRNASEGGRGYKNNLIEISFRIPWNEKDILDTYTDRFKLSLGQLVDDFIELEFNRLKTSAYKYNLQEKGSKSDEYVEYRIRIPKNFKERIDKQSDSIGMTSQKQLVLYSFLSGYYNNVDKEIILAFLHDKDILKYAESIGINPLSAQALLKSIITTRFSNEYLQKIITEHILNEIIYSDSASKLIEQKQCESKLLYKKIEDYINTVLEPKFILNYLLDFDEND